MKIRKYIRHPADIPIEIQFEDIVADKVEYLNNIGLGGLSFRSIKEVKIGSALRIKIPLVKPIFETVGRVVWCRKNGDIFDIGVKFVVPDDAYRARMVEQVCYIEHYKKEILDKEHRKISGQEAAIEWIQKYAKKFPLPPNLSDVEPD